MKTLKRSLSTHRFIHLFPPLLELGNKVLNVLYAYLFDFSGQNAPGFIIILYPGQLLVIFNEEGKVLMWHIDFCPAAQLFLFLCRILSAGEGVIVYLILDLIGFVGEENVAISYPRELFL